MHEECYFIGPSISVNWYYHRKQFTLYAIVALLLFQRGPCYKYVVSCPQYFQVLPLFFTYDKSWAILLPQQFFFTY